MPMINDAPLILFVMININITISIFCVRTTHHTLILIDELQLTTNLSSKALSPLQSQSLSPAPAIYNYKYIYISTRSTKTETKTV
jgi:hypothetical protein